jgi:ADP-ribose pyrophosphatase YjhB (NUDIX family)
MRRVPENDSRERYVCGACDTVHYENPRNVVGTIPIWQDQIMLCRRAIEPRYGYWTLPAGFMEIGESPQAGAARETLEEAGVEVQIGELFALVNASYAHQLHLFYLAKMPSEHYSGGVESLEVRLFHEDDIPWSELAFQTSYHALKLFLADRARGLFAPNGLTGQFRLHTLDLSKPTSPATLVAAN